MKAMTVEVIRAVLEEQSAKRRLSPLARRIIGLDR
jgi:hypothetical protein